MNDRQIWDAAADSFQRSFELGLNDYNRRLLSFLEENQMIFPGCRAADVGCGVGTYGRELKKRGCEVTLIDISPKMLEYAECNMAVPGPQHRSLLLDFASERTEGSFDFSIAAMSPAVSDAETVKKLDAMTTGTCFITRFRSWEQPDRDRVLSLCGLPTTDTRDKHKRGLDELIGAISSVGITPCIRYENYCWCDKLTAAQTAEKLARHCSAALTPELEKKLLSAITELSEDGIFTDRVNTTAAWIYWRK